MFWTNISYILNCFSKSAYLAPANWLPYDSMVSGPQGWAILGMLSGQDFPLFVLILSWQLLFVSDILLYSGGLGTAPHLSALLLIYDVNGVFAICNLKRGGVDIWFFLKTNFNFNCSYTFSNKISYMYIWDIQCTCTHIDIKFLCMMVTETLCVWWWQKHYVYDGDKHYVYDGDRNIMCMMVTTLCVWWWQKHYVYDGDRNIMRMMVTNIMCIFSCWSSFLGYVLPLSQKCIFPSNFRYNPSRTCEIHVS